MNSVNLVGRLTAKPELRFTNSNRAVTRFTVAVNRQKSEGADFINCVVWGKQAENIQKYLDKGSMISLQGRIQTGSYTNNQGQKIYTTDIVAESVQFLNNKKNNNQQVSEQVSMQVSEQVDNQTDIFADFGEQVSLDDNFLDD